jgi:hypothetical protein
MGIAGYVDWTTNLYLALARRDTSTALKVCNGMEPATRPWRFLEEVDCGRLLSRRGRYRDAEQLLRPMYWSLGPVSRVMRTLEWARAAQAAGDQGEASAGLAFVNAAWRTADSSVLFLTAQPTSGPNK